MSYVPKTRHDCIIPSDCRWQNATPPVKLSYTTLTTVLLQRILELGKKMTTVTLQIWIPSMVGKHLEHFSMCGHRKLRKPIRVMLKKKLSRNYDLHKS